MKRTFLLCAAISFLPLSLIAQNVTVTGQNGSVAVVGGEYSVMNNVWGSATDVQELSVDSSGTFFKVIQSSANNATNGKPASYPFIYKGCHFGGCTSTNNPLPMRVNQIRSAPITWSIDEAGVSGNFDCAYESWFDAGGTSSTQAAELMVWINYQGTISPGGNKISTVQIGGLTWDVYFAPAATWGWNYIAYKITSPIDSLSCDFKDFIRDAASRGYIYTTWYLDNMEAGFEIWTEGTGLTTNSFSGSVVGGAPDTNYAPVHFALTSPGNGKALSSMVIPFKWQPSIDPDDTNQSDLEYILHLSGPGLDTTMADIYADTLTFDGTQRLKPLTTYTWYVLATDGIDTTWSSNRFTFKTPNTTGVGDVNLTPLKYLLSQNYPNPFNPSTTIQFNVKERVTATLEIYDILGQKVLEQNYGTLDAGNHYETIKMDGFVGGVYFYRIIAFGPDGQSFTSVEKLTLIK